MIKGIFTLLFVSFTLVFLGAFSQRTPKVKSFPDVPGNTFAFGLDVLLYQFILNVNKSEPNPFEYCTMDDFTPCRDANTEILTNGNQCLPMSQCSDSFNCTYKPKSERIVLDFKFQNVTKSFKIIIVCSVLPDNKLTLFAVRASIQKCRTNAPLLVNATSFFKSSGNFYCNNSGKLVYSNGTELISPQTTCLVNAQWDGQKDLQCWKAPDNVQLLGNFTATAGENITLFCLYTGSMPTSNASKLFSENSKSFYSKDHNHVIVNVDKNYNDRQVYCQALTPYTQKINKTAGRSSSQRLNILYSPSSSNLTCIWFLNSFGSCSVMLDSNPRSKFILLEKDNSSFPITMNTSDDFFYEVREINKTSQIFIFNKLKVNLNDSGTYTVMTSTPKLNTLTNFTFIVSTVERPFLSLQEIIGVSVGAVVVSALLALILYCLKHKGHEMSEESDANAKHVYVNTNGSDCASPEESDIGIKDDYITLDNIESSPESNIADEVAYEIPEKNQPESNAADDVAYEILDKKQAKSKSEDEVAYEIPDKLETSDDLDEGVYEIPDQTQKDTDDVKHTYANLKNSNK